MDWWILKKKTATHPRKDIWCWVLFGYIPPRSRWTASRLATSFENTLETFSAFLYMMFFRDLFGQDAKYQTKTSMKITEAWDFWSANSACVFHTLKYLFSSSAKKITCFWLLAGQTELTYSAFRNIAPFKRHGKLSMIMVVLHHHMEYVHTWRTSARRLWMVHTLWVHEVSLVYYSEFVDIVDIVEALLILISTYKERKRTVSLCARSEYVWIRAVKFRTLCALSHRTLTVLTEYKFQHV